MNLKLFATLIIIALTKVTISQNSSVKGKVIDEKTGETLPGATVMINGATTGANTDLDGNFTLADLAPGTYTLLCRLMSYNTKIIDGIIVKKGEPTILTISIGSASTDLGMIEVTATASRESNTALLIAQKNSPTISDGISSEIIKRTPDKNTSDVLKRVSGASIQDNKFAVIRGLNDRYNSAYINGAPLPSSESDKKAFAFDIFPANMLDNLIIIKTATPDLPGDFAGGIIQINTKSIPDKNEQILSVSIGYNTLTTFKNFKTYKGGKYDFVGMDDGTRGIPKGLSSTEEYSEGLTNIEKAENAKLMVNSWALYNRKANPNISLQYSIARTGKLFHKEIGNLFALTYNNSFSINEEIRRDYEEQSTGVVKRMELTDTIYSQSIMASSMWNIAYKINDNNKISLKNIYSINSDDKVTLRGGAKEFDQPEKYWQKSSLRWFTQNNLLSSQIIGNHLLPKTKIRINWTGGYSDIRRSIPNMRRMVYEKVASTAEDPGVQYAAVVQTNGTIPTVAGNMFFSNTLERIYSFNYDVCYPFSIAKIKNEIKLGGYHQFRDRSFSARSLGFSRYRQGSIVKFDSELLLLPEDQIFSVENMGVMDKDGPYNGGFKLDEATKTSDSYTASSLLHAGFIMLDTKPMNNLRIIAGARVESYNQKLETIIAGSDSPLQLDSTVTDVLPSTNIIYSLTETVNIRASYYRTVSRPEFRELAPFLFYDFITDFAISGNQFLKRSLIDNYDLRFEWYPGAGQLFSASGFYKRFTNPIEQASRPDATRELYFVNVPKASNIGVELEYRVKLSSLLKADSSVLLNATTLFANVAWIKSKVDVSHVIGAQNTSRPLQGQSPLIINAGIQYLSSSGTSLSVSYNFVGRRIFIVGNQNEPDYWENPRHIIDLQISQKIFKNLDAKVNIKDLLAQPSHIYQDLNKNNTLDEREDNVMITRKYGQIISFSLSYRF
jgi:outer membrane receptor protein involved in Fe transport